MSKPKRPASIAEEWDHDEEMVRIKTMKSDARKIYAESAEAREVSVALRAGKGSTPDWELAPSGPGEGRFYVWEDDE